MYQIHLRTTWLQRTIVVSANPKQKHLCDIPKIETNPTAIRLAIFPDLLPDEVGLVLESPCIHNGKPFGE